MRRYKWKRSRVKNIDVCYPVDPSEPTALANRNIQLVAVNWAPNPPESQKSEQPGVKKYVLLKEVEESNNWARSGFQLFVGWFALQFVINVAAIIALIMYRGTPPSFARAVYAVLIGWNLVGSILSLLVQKSMHDCDLRIRDVLGNVTKESDPDDPPLKPRSAIPLEAINIVCLASAVTLFILMAFWTIVFVS
jgi:hypothetical protein